MIDLSDYQQLLDPIDEFLLCQTPSSWIEEASKPQNLPMLLIDHMICELKAAQTAAWLVRKYAVNATSATLLLKWLEPYENLIYRKEGTLADLLQKNHAISKKLTLRDECSYGENLVDKMIMLIKEELHHFCQVLEIMQYRDVDYQHITAGRYAKGLMQQVRTHEPATLIDKLICGAYIEARSCERFAKLAPYVDEDLANFYVSLLRSEARHYQDYLTLAQQISHQDISVRVSDIGRAEAALISSQDSEFRFHSGIPIK